MASGALDGSFTENQLGIRERSFTGSVRPQNGAERDYKPTANNDDFVTRDAVRYAAEIDHATEAEKGVGLDAEGYFTSEMEALPPWYRQITLRGILLGIVLSFTFAIIVLKLALTSGVIPSLNISAGLLAFFFIKTWVVLCGKSRLFNPRKFTAQENTFIQTVVVAGYSLSFSGGFGNYYLGLAQVSYDRLGSETQGNNLADTWSLSIGRSMAYMLCIGLIGTFMLVLLRKVFIIDYKLTYPSGYATGMLIKSFHTVGGGDLAMKQVKSLGKWFSVSFLWTLFKWFFEGGHCDGWGRFPTFGIPARDLTFNFGFSTTYVGVGMIVPPTVNWSMMAGAIFSWGILWRIIQSKEGDWYPEGLSGSSLSGFGGYRNFLSIAIFMADGIYCLGKVIYISVLNFMKRNSQTKYNEDDMDVDEVDLQRREELQRRVFINDNIPWWIAVVGYIAFGVLGTIVIPLLYKPVKFYYVLISYIIGPVFAIANAYGAGLTDWSMASTYGKIAIFAMSAWAGKDGQGVTVGLVTCGIMMASTAAAADLMQDFKTAYITLASAKAMFYGQIIGSLMSVILAPVAFQLFWSAFPVGVEGSAYPAPYASIYRSMAVIGTEGLGSLPKHCVLMAGVLFGATFVINGVRDLLPYKFARFLPIMLAFAIPFNLSAQIPIDMCVGSLIVTIWGYLRPISRDQFAAPAACGLIAGEGLFAIPSAILAIANIKQPVCMQFAKQYLGTSMVGAASGMPLAEVSND